ncbi:MAG: hypothetical protein IJ567_08285 [Lachnospiraceae bacterium]|nr:hypothetical protein [Lachnospiraceae bacterium]
MAELEEIQVQETWICGGFSFSDEEQARQAQKETEAVEYIRERMDLNQPDVVRQMYGQLVEEKIFATPVGYAYLKELRDYLLEIPYTLEENIPAIPVESQPPEEGEKPEAAGEPEEDGVSVQPEDLGEKNRRERQDGQRQVRHDQKRYRTLLTVNLLLVVLVIAMFVITMTSGNTTILNYETELINKYEQWEQELEEREDELDAREAQLR